MDHTTHLLDSDSAVADTVGNIPSQASSSSRRRVHLKDPNLYLMGRRRKLELTLELTFDLRRVANFSIIRRMNDAWKRHKSRLNKKYIKGKDLAKVKATPPPFVPKKVWVEFLDMCNSYAFQAQSKKNTKNRNKVKAPCTTGRNSMVVVCHNLVMERNVPDEDVGRADVFIKAHTRADKTYQFPKIIEKLQENMNLYPDSNKIGHDDVLGKQKQSNLNREYKLNGGPEGIVAYGIVADVSPDAYCHNKQLGDGYYMIEIFNVINEDALLFRQDSFTKTMGDVGTGGFVAWSKSFIIFTSRFLLLFFGKD
ncbi:hypothetical protein GIB67_038751 [Kingdonia uniflora]|uniref:Transposase n=1 Tax=Kingdonia uniflora TaxID=39325 RepID=A0A7J7NTH5_9MAGN|nr:hypothetical protein GIB67_038751 [Kingdonia uniflora]